MDLRLMVVLFCVVMIFLFPGTARANDTEKLYYMSVDGAQEVMKTKNYEFVGDFRTEEKAFVLFSELFGEGDVFAVIPNGVELINIFLCDGCLYVNVSEDITGYGGGGAFEYELREQIIRTALSLPEVEAVTLLINGELRYLPEGSLILDERKEYSFAD